MNDTSYFIFFLLSYFALDSLYNAAIIKWQQAKDIHLQRLYSRLWHVMGAVIKLLVISVALLALGIFSWQKIVLAGAVNFIWFDTLLNFFRGLRADYIGTEADTDKAVRWLGVNPLVLKIVILLIAVLLNVIM